jgi:hypothetical protein
LRSDQHIFDDRSLEGEIETRRISLPPVESGIDEYMRFAIDPDRYAGYRG